MGENFGLFKSFGDRLFEGETPTNLGMIGSESIGIDVDAQAFFDRVTAAGGSLTATEQNAIITLVADMKFTNVWNSMQAVYPMVGASAAACAQNLISASFTGTFTSGWTFSSSGIVSNGTSAYFNTNCRKSVDLPNFNSHWSYVGYSSSWSGVWNFGPAFGFENNGGIGLQNLTGISPPAPSSFRLMSGSVNSNASNDSILYFDGTQHGTYTPVSMTQDIAFTLGALNTGIYPTITPTIWSTINMKTLTLGTALNSTKMSNLYSALNTFNTTLGR